MNRQIEAEYKLNLILDNLRVAEGLDRSVYLELSEKVIQFADEMRKELLKVSPDIDRLRPVRDDEL